MTSATPISVPPVDPTRVLQCAGELLRQHSQWQVNKIFELEDAVHSCWRFQIDVLTGTYRANRLDSITVSADDMRMSHHLPANSQISPMAVFSRKTLHRYGPGRLLAKRSGRSYTKYSFDWAPNGCAHSVIVGDLAQTVLTWRLNRRSISYAQHTLTVPDSRSWRLWLTIDRWRQNMDTLVPEEIALHPAAAFDYVRHLPDFTDALNALLAFDSHVPSAVSPEKADWTMANAREPAETYRRVRADLSALPVPVVPSQQTPDEPAAETAPKEDRVHSAPDEQESSESVLPKPEAGPKDDPDPVVRDVIDGAIIGVDPVLEPVSPASAEPPSGTTAPTVPEPGDDNSDQRSNSLLKTPRP